MSQKQFEAAVVIGRFQIPHEGHIKLFNEAKKLADKLVIIVGSVGQPKTPKNPFSFEERKTMLKMVIPKGIDYEILPVRDQRYNTQHWVVDVVNKVNSTLPPGWTDYPREVALIGHKKDSSSFYLDLFPQWKLIEVEDIEAINATDIRNELFDRERPHSLPHTDLKIQNVLADWIKYPPFSSLLEEYEFTQEYKKAWEAAPHPPTFVTVDAVVIQSGHLLLVKRRAAPGRGLYALPGGFLEQEETLENAVLRELKEETKIKLQDIVLRRSITERRVYDDPNRSSRGRTITHAFLFELTGHELPKIRGDSDAEKAVWVPLNEVFTMGAYLYEDHLDIILNITGNK